MKLSISLPNSVAQEIRHLAELSERPLSWWIQQAWGLARERLLRGAHDDTRAQRRSLKSLGTLRGSLKKAFPHTDAVTLAHAAFKKK